jgi:hypothetical protein
MIGISEHRHASLGGAKMRIGDLNTHLGNSPLGAYGSNRACASGIAAAYRYAQRHFGQPVADRLALIFVDRNGNYAYKV